jgi:hypothetical protein
MPETTGKGAAAGALDVRLSVPAQGDLRGIAGDLAGKIAEHLGAAGADAASIRASVAALTTRLGTSATSHDVDITFTFRHAGGELVIEARCNGQTSEVRQPLTA